MLLYLYIVVSLSRSVKDAYHFMQMHMFFTAEHSIGGILCLEHLSSGPANWLCT